MKTRTIDSAGHCCVPEIVPGLEWCLVDKLNEWAGR